MDFMSCSPQVGEHKAKCNCFTMTKPSIPSPTVLAILLKRIDTRAKALEGVRLDGYSVAIHELRTVAEWMRRAKSYLETTPK
jgi:hypothetical protein